MGRGTYGRFTEELDGAVFDDAFLTVSSLDVADSVVCP